MDYADRLERARKAAGAAGLDALLVTPGPDLRYLTGYPAVSLERLTCLVLPADGDPLLVVPRLERPAALASPVGGLDLEVARLGRDRRPVRAGRPAAAGPGGPGRGRRPDARGQKVLAFRDALPGAEQSLAGAVLGAAADAQGARRGRRAAPGGRRRSTGCTPRTGEWLRPGRTEREVGHDIAEAIVERWPPAGRLRRRRLGPQRRQPAPRGVRPAYRDR